MKKPALIFAIVTFLISFLMAFVIAKSVFKQDIDTSKKNVGLQSEVMQDGDIIFQTSQSAQCEAVRIATNSKFSHCGIIFTIDGKKMVLEAVQPVKFTNVDVWISHGKDSKYVLKRLINAETKLSSMVIEKMKLYGKSFLNKDYDVYFSWNDNEIYCSELVWKIYKNAANFELCKTAKLKSFQLDDTKVKLILKQRYGNAIPFDEAVVAPSQLVESKILKTIFDNY